MSETVSTPRKSKPHPAWLLLKVPFWILAAALLLMIGYLCFSIGRAALRDAAGANDIEKVGIIVGPGNKIQIGKTTTDAQLKLIGPDRVIWAGGSGSTVEFCPSLESYKTFAGVILMLDKPSYNDLVGIEKKTGCIRPEAYADYRVISNSIDALVVKAPDGREFIHGYL